MKFTCAFSTALLIVGVTVLGAQGQAQGGKAPAVKRSSVPQTPEWKLLTSLVGQLGRRHGGKAARRWPRPSRCA